MQARTTAKYGQQETMLLCDIIRCDNTACTQDFIELYVFITQHY